MAIAGDETNMNELKDHAAVLLEKKMDRAGFIKHVGLGLVAMTGVAALMKSLSEGAQSRATVNGYGSEGYGGQPRR